MVTRQRDTDRPRADELDPSPVGVGRSPREKKGEKSVDLLPLKSFTRLT